MANLLNDEDLRRLFGTVISNADESCLRPNSYILRLGSHGEFLNTGKEFLLDAKIKGIRIQPGHSVGVTALEKIDFRREIVEKVFPGADLHGLLSPTTDLSREGIVAPTTQVDAGYMGTLNWTITNTSSSEARFTHGERIFRLAIFRLQEGENPTSLYSGDYQEREGYIRSRRSGPPVGMKDSEWEDAFVKGGPEDKFEELIKSGYPWHILGSRLKEVDQQLKTVTEEYGEIHDSISALNNQVNQIQERQKDTPETVRKVLREETSALQNRWLIGSASLIVAAIGIGLSLWSNATVWGFIENHGVSFGLGISTVAAVLLYFLSRQK